MAIKCSAKITLVRVNDGSTGPQGPTGNGISSITRQYYLSTSKTTQTGGSWSTTAPNWSNNKYLWIRDKIVYTNSTTPVYTTPYCDNSWEAVNNVESQILAWCYNNDTTYINGSKIYANSITTNKLATDAIKSVNYVKNSKGSFLNLADGSFDSKYLKWTKEGALDATSGHIGKVNITGNGLNAEYVYDDEWGDDRLTYIPTRGFIIDGSDASISTYDVGSGRDYQQYTSAQSISIASATTVSQSDPRAMDLTDSSLIFVRNGEEIVKIVALNDGTAQISSENSVSISPSLKVSGTISSTGAISSSGSITSASALISNGGAIELFGATPFIDFHHRSSSADYTARLIADTASRLRVVGGLRVDGGFSIQDSIYASNAKFIYWSNTSGTNTQLLGFDSNNVYNVGNGSYATVLKGSSVKLGSTSGSAVTSDRNLKTDIKDIGDDYLEFFMALKPVTYKYELGKSKRTHVGFEAQNVEEALKSSGLTNEEFGGICIDDVVYTEENKDDEYDDMNYAYSKGLDKIYSLRYEEFIALNTKMIQQQQQRIDDLENEVAELTNLVQQLLNKGA